MDGKISLGVGDCFFSKQYLWIEKAYERQIWQKGGVWNENDACTSIYGKSFLVVGKVAKKLPKRCKKTTKRATYSPHIISETKNSRNAEIGTNIARGVRRMPDLFILTAFIRSRHTQMVWCPEDPVMVVTLFALLGY